MRNNSRFNLHFAGQTLYNFLSGTEYFVTANFRVFWEILLHAFDAFALVQALLSF